MRARLIVIAAGAALVAACNESNMPMAPQEVGPLAEIVDGGHGSGNQSFFWLPPIVLGSGDGGANVSGLAPVVKILECTGGDCSTLGGTVAEFTTLTGPGSETVRDGGDHYIVNWHTARGSDDGVVPGGTYRVCVSVDAMNLGHADVLVGSIGKDLRDARDNGKVPLVDGSTLPIKFRIEDGYADGGSDTGCGGTVLPTTLSGTVTVDGGAPPVPVLVVLFQGTESVSAAVTTDGSYFLPAPAPGAYTACAKALLGSPGWTLAGSVTCPDGSLGFAVTLSPGPNVQNFAFASPQT